MLKTICVNNIVRKENVYDDDNNVAEADVEVAAGAALRQSPWPACAGSDRSRGWSN